MDGPPPHQPEARTDVAERMDSDKEHGVGNRAVSTTITEPKIGVAGPGGSEEGRSDPVQPDPDESRDAASPTATPRYTRRLSDKVLIAFHHACDQGDFEVADHLLRVLEMMLTRRPLTPNGSRRRDMESLVAAHERLWYLRHPETGLS